MRERAHSGNGGLGSVKKGMFFDTLHQYPIFDSPTHSIYPIYLSHLSKYHLLIFLIAF